MHPVLADAGGRLYTGLPFENRAARHEPASPGTSDDQECLVKHRSRRVSEDFLPIKGYDHIEFFVGNAKQAAHFYDKTFGFKPVAKRALETGCRDRASYVMEQGRIRFVFTSAYGPDSEITRFCTLHGDGTRAIGLEVADVRAAVEQVRKRGATVVTPATALEDEYGTLVAAEIRYAGDTIFRFVERGRYHGSFCPGFKPIEAHGSPPVGLAAIDHVVTNVYLGEMNYWVDWYERVMGFTNLCGFTDKDISTEYSALMSKVMENGTGKCKFPINEPAEGKKKSQIDEYLDYYQGPGVQHIAMNTANIYETVTELRRRDIDFLRVPDTYYEYMRDRVGDVGEDWDKLHELGILIDKDEDGYLLQIFTQPVQDRPTLFYEVIERHGSRGFGIGNFKALFVSIEQEQAARGNL
jgi:4-hydroxyphenylpyruvate dioxygenase